MPFCLQEQLAAALEGARARSAAGLLAVDAVEGSLAHRWNAATAELLAADAATATPATAATTPAALKSQQWWRKVRDAYTDPYRQYHTLQHLNAMFGHFDQHVAQLKSPALVTMTIFFHDIVYAEENVGKHPKNEMDSAVLWREFASDVGLTAEQTDEVAAWIERTGSHLKGGKTEGDLAYFLDFDLAILGESPAAYAEYTQQIRLEYASVPLKEFREKRGAFMPQFLASESLYFTEHFKTHYEGRARQNVQDEIARLVGADGGGSSGLSSL